MMKVGVLFFSKALAINLQSFLEDFALEPRNDDFALEPGGIHIGPSLLTNNFKTQDVGPLKTKEEWEKRKSDIKNNKIAKIYDQHRYTPKELEKF